MELIPQRCPRWWSLAEEGGAARCGLCFRACRISLGKTGLCGVRAFDGTRLISPVLGLFSSVAIDPIEKKPLRHWRPGTRIYSLGSFGCTMRCPFCQNHSIAQPPLLGKNPLPRLMHVSPEALRKAVTEAGLAAVAYTYNEPALQAEYILDAAPLLRDAGIATVLVSNGMYSPELLRDLIPWVDAANIDVKTFNAETYRALGGSLETVMDTVRKMVQAGTHVELTTLVVPGVSDSPEEFEALVEWIASLSPDIPLHISRYFPAHKYTKPPTPLPVLERFAAIAGTRLRRVHIGNV